MPIYQLCRVPTLRNMCVSMLVEFRDCLGNIYSASTLRCMRRPVDRLLVCIEDIGDTPLELIQPVLLQCNAEQLASIEDGSRCSCA